MTIFAQEDQVFIHPNKGQWDSQILYNIDLPNGHFYFDKQGYTAVFRNGGHAHNDQREHQHEENTFHAVKISFINGNLNSAFEETDSSTFYRNYFLGDNQFNWKSNVFSLQKIVRKSLYPGIDVEATTKDGQLKFNYLLAANAQVNQIKLKYEGFSSVSIERDGSLLMSYPFGTIKESKPIAWSIQPDGSQTPVNIAYKLRNNIVTFQFPDGYDSTLPLVIDPVLAFSTFTGATSDNWGFTAAPDPQGNAFGGGIAFASGYPTTVGALDNSFNGGNVDAAISKFSANGNQLLYSTYIGGNSSETPHSIVCGQNGEIYIMGVTGSANFPTSATGYDKTFNGGTSTSANSISFQNGTDIFVFKLSATGNAMLGSTFIGGSNNDGINLGQLNYNYGDQFRGDITLDRTGNIFVASTSLSTNFPTVNGTSTNAGGQEAVVFKLNNDCSQLLWSTYLGGSQADAAYSIQVTTNGSVYVAGGSRSTSMNFPTGINITNLGGTDGFIAYFNNQYILEKGSFVGTNQYDQIYFLQLDLDQNVYVFGQSLGAINITSGKYNTPNSGQFIKKFNATFDQELWSTTIGSAIKRIDISPTAFLISDCYDIYLAGWGGSVNRDNSQAVNSSTNYLPVTNDAFQKTTNGNNFYIAVLSPDATALKYATFIGGQNSSANHVDGGTSRFDKNGKIYHSVCAACGGSPNGFTTTPGVYAPTNRSSNCNMAVFKFELSFIQTTITNLNPVVCLPGSFTFNNVTTNGNSYYWEFGDGNTSTVLAPTHTYAGPGTYEISFVVKDTNNCFVSDTAKFTVVVKEFNARVFAPSDTVCPNVSQQLTAQGGVSYLWSPAQYLNNATIANPIATVNESTDFMVIVSDNECGKDTVYTRIEIFNDSINISKDTTICIGGNVQLSAEGTTNYEWSPTTYLNNPNAANPIATPSTTTTYTVRGLSPNLCPLEATTTINVVLTPPQPNIPDSVYICKNASATITVSGADSFSWSPNLEINTIVGPQVMISPTQSRYYYCDFTNICETIRDSVYAKIIAPTVHAWNDTIICPGQAAILYASGANTYSWTPTVTTVIGNGSIVTAIPTQPTIYQVTGTDIYGCKAYDNVRVDLYPQAFIQTLPDVYAVYGETVQLGATSTTPGIYNWSPAEYLSCQNCAYPTAEPNRNFEYVVTYTDNNGCSASDRMKIFYEPLLYVPNTFTPDASGRNDHFRVYGVNISDITLDIYDRWGELIHTIKGFDDYWDGTYKGLECPIGTYVWKIEYTDIINDIILSKTGHINLVR